MTLLPQTQVLKDLFNDVPLVIEANDSHFTGALGTNQKVYSVDLLDELGPALF